LGITRRPPSQKRVNVGVGDGLMQEVTDSLSTEIRDTDTNFLIDL